MGYRPKQRILNCGNWNCQKHLKKCSISSVIREIQIKKTLRLHLIQFRMAKFVPTPSGQRAEGGPVGSFAVMPLLESPHSPPWVQECTREVQSPVDLSLCSSGMSFRHPCGVLCGFPWSWRPGYLLVQTGRVPTAFGTRVRSQFVDGRRRVSVVLC